MYLVFLSFLFTVIILNADCVSKWYNLYLNPLSLVSLILILQKEVGIKVAFQYSTTVTFWQLINNHNSDFSLWKVTCKYFFKPSTDWETSPAASHFVRKTAWDASQVSACCLFSGLTPWQFAYRETDRSICLSEKAEVHGRGEQTSPSLWQLFW